MLHLSTVLVFIEESEGQITVSFIAEEDLQAYRTENNIVGEIALSPNQRRGDLIISALADETIGTDEEEEGFAGAFRDCNLKSFQAGIKYGLELARKTLKR